MNFLTYVDHSLRGKKVTSQNERRAKLGIRILYSQVLKPIFLVHKYKNKILISDE